MDKESVTKEKEKFICFGGKNYTLQTNGYYREYSGKYLHRAVWEYFNGKIPEGYVIHHIDGDKSNNDLTNLQLMTISDHTKSHMEIAQHICKYCGKEFESKCNFTGKCHFCSSACKHKWHRKNNLELRICAECGKAFKTYKNGKVRYCSKKCSARARVRENTKKIVDN